MTVQNPPELKDGDEVEVVLRGKVRYADSSPFIIGDASLANSIWPEAEHVKSIELIRRPLSELKQGDIIADPSGRAGGAFLYDPLGPDFDAQGTPLVYLSISGDQICRRYPINHIEHADYATWTVVGNIKEITKRQSTQTS